MYFKQQTALCYSTMKKIVTQAIYSTISFLLASIKWHFRIFFLDIICITLPQHRELL